MKIPTLEKQKSSIDLMLYIEAIDRAFYWVWANLRLHFLGCLENDDLENEDLRPRKRRPRKRRPKKKPRGVGGA